MANVRYTREHEWIRVEGDIGTVGITDYAQRQLGDVVFVELPSVGKTLSKGDEAAVVESVKAASEVYAPVSGEVVEACNSPGGFTVSAQYRPLSPTEKATMFYGDRILDLDKSGGQVLRRLPFVVAGVVDAVWDTGAGVHQK